MIDFKKITAESKLYTFHAHTQFCDGRDTMEAIAAAAAEQGFTHLGFSPHSPIPFATPCNMSKASVPLYLDEIYRLKAKYAGKMEVFPSMEIDFTEVSGPADDYYQQLPLDYRIGSVHFIPSFDNPQEQIDIDGHPDEFADKMHRYFHDDIEAVVRSFYAQSVKMVERGGFDIIGHFDKIGFNASSFKPGIDLEPWYDKLVRNLFEAIADLHLTVEVNTKSWKPYGRFFPASRYFAMLKRSGLAVVFNSDAHFASKVNDGRMEAMRQYALAE